MHRHRFEVSSDSVFGLKHIHAIMKCQERVAGPYGVICGAKLIRVVSYDELEVVGDKRKAYFYVPKEGSDDAAIASVACFEQPA